MSSLPLRCPFCRRNNFKSQGGLTQHQLHNKQCFAKLCEDNGAKAGGIPAAKVIAIAHTVLLKTDFAAATQSTHAQTNQETWPNDSINVLQMGHVYDDDSLIMAHDDDSLEEDMHEIGNNVAQNNVENNNEPSNKMRSDFRQFVGKSRGFSPFHGEMAHAIKLLQLLRTTKSSLGMYEDMYRWHLETNGLIRPHETLANSPYFVSRDHVYRFLRERYNRMEGYGNIREIVLPYSKQKARILWNDAAKVIQALLTDPRIRADDYLFHGQNPFAPPPNDLNYIADLNTGKCYIETYKALITNPERQILVPTPLYIDGAATGQFVDLPITPVQISLGIHTRKARDKPHCWGTLGYIPDPSKVKSHGKRQLVNSGHVEGTIAYHEMLRNEGQAANNNYNKAQDLHAMLAVILESYRKIQEKGLLWDFVYNGNVYKDVELVFFVPFIKCDTQEADDLCGSYKSRGANVSQLCRYCECPTMQSGDPLISFPLKTKNKIQRLVNNGDLDALKGLSQQYIQNAFYPLRFGAHSEQHIHGATPLEMLHHLLLGTFSSVRDVLFCQIGETSSLASDVNALAVQYGCHLSRQSDRSMPKAKFYGGIVRGKLTAKEYPGILLVILCLLNSGHGQMLLKKKRRFQKYHVIPDWILLIETLLQWEMWLKRGKMTKNHVLKSRKKHKYIMQLMLKISRRTKGMGMNTTKFHGILHMTDDILAYGVPLEYDTGTKEQHHSVNKTAAKLTQKNKEKFEEQVHRRREEVELLDLARVEMNGQAVFDYFESCDLLDQGQRRADQGQMLSELDDLSFESTDNDFELMGNDPMERVDGKCFGVKTLDNGVNIMYSKTRVSGRFPCVPCEQDFIDFLVGLQDKTDAWCGNLAIKTRYKRDEVLFRADFNFRGGYWRDWVIVDWGHDYGQLPNKIWGFVDLHGLPPGNNGISYGGLDHVGPGLYAIVESSTASTQAGGATSELLTPIMLEIGATDRGYVTQLRFYLAEVEAFVGPAVVVPDIGGPKNSYFWVKSRHSWADLFESWLSQPIELLSREDYEDNSEEDDSDSDASLE